MNRVNVYLLFVAVVLAALVLAAVITSCAAPPRQQPVDSKVVNVAQEVCVYPESDNSNRWGASSCVPVETTVYTLRIMVDDEMASNVTNKSEGSAFAYGNYATASYRSWQEGKGQLPVKVLSISPEFPGVKIGKNIILKTSDSKTMALPNGAVTEVICNQDVEVLSPNQNMQTLTIDRLTYELDDCRMKTPTYEVP